MAARRMPKPVRKERAQLPINSLTPNPKNPRKHPDHQIERLVHSLKRFGQTRDILVTGGEQNIILAGEGTWLAAKRAGFKVLDVTLLYFDDRLADEYLVADNFLQRGAEDDMDRVAAMFEEFAEADDFDPMALGFTRDEADVFLNEADLANIDIISIDTDVVTDDFWITVQGPLKQQAEALSKVREVMAEIPEVTVEIGTVTGVD